MPFSVPRAVRTDTMSSLHTAVLARDGYDGERLEFARQSDI